MANKPKKELDGRSNMSTGTKVVIGVFAVVMALSTMLPSLTSIFAQHDTGEQESQEQTDETANDENKDGEKSDENKDGENKDGEKSDEKKDEKKEADEFAKVPDNEQLKTLAEDNKKEIESLELEDVTKRGPGSELITGHIKDERGGDVR